MCFVHTLSATESEEGERARERAEQERGQSKRGERESRDIVEKGFCGLGQE